MVPLHIYYSFDENFYLNYKGWKAGVVPLLTFCSVKRANIQKWPKMPLYSVPL